MTKAQIMNRKARLFCLVVAAMCFSAVALAQDIQHFKPTQGSWNYLSVESARTSPSPGLYGALGFGYATKPLVYRESGGQRDAVIQDLTTFELGAVIGLNPRVDVSLALPIGYGTRNSDLDVDDGSGIGDLRLSPKIQILGAGQEQGVGLAVATQLAFPTSTDEYVFSQDHFTITPRLILEHRWSSVRLAVNGGYRWLPVRSDNLPLLAVGNGMTYGVATALYPWDLPMEVLLEGFGTAYVGDSPSEAAPHPTEILVGVRLRDDRGLAFTLSGGGGLSDDFSAPELRVFAAMSWRMGSGRAVRVVHQAGGSQMDSDGDGVKDSADKCPALAEDLDAFEDADGCPDLDNDQDSIADSADLCPKHAEDYDGYADQDGCPDPDNDGDGIQDQHDPQPLTAGGYPTTSANLPQRDVFVQENRIHHLKPIYFDSETSAVRRDSYGVLEDIRQVLLANPEFTKVRIEGHTDAWGSETFNEELAIERAESVKSHLVERGIDPARLVVRGIGERRTVGDGKSSSDANLSRRVEFLIIERKPVS